MRIIEYVGTVQVIVASPFAIIASFYLIYQYINVYTFIPYGIIFILIVILSIVNDISVKKRHKFSKWGAKRSVILNQVIPNIKMVKTNSMEHYFLRLL